MDSYDKPFKTYEQQINLLKEKYKLNVFDEEFALQVLSTVSYYDLVNGYKECMMIDGFFREDISIEFIYMFHLFDKGFQNIIFKQIMFIENSFKTKLSYILAKNFGVHEKDYLNAKHYSFKNDFERLRVKINKEGFNYPQNPSKHYLENHNHVPPWILFKNLNFYIVIELFQLLKSEEKEELVKSFLSPRLSEFIEYDQMVSFVVSSLNLLRLFRNQIAHNQKFVTYKTKKLNPNKKNIYYLAPKIITEITSPNLLRWKDINKKSRGTYDIYAVIISIIHLLNDPYLIQTFCDEILSYIEPQNDTENEIIKANLFINYAKITNLPEDLSIRLTKYMQTKR